jgi:hypothetical protein
MPRHTDFITGLLLSLWIAGPALAQLKADPSPWALSHDTVKVHPDELVDLHTTTPPPIDPYEYKRGLFAALGLYEYKPALAVPGQYERPHYALGFSSEAVRSALSASGLDAESCVAPLVRLRARPTAITGSTGISMSLLARCTFR